MTKVDPEKDRRGWHLDKTFSVTHLVTTVTIAGSVMIWALNMDKRVAILEQVSIQQKVIDRQQDERGKESLDNLRTDLKDISQKLDRLIERTK